MEFVACRGFGKRSAGGVSGRARENVGHAVVPESRDGGAAGRLGGWGDGSLHIQAFRSVRIATVHRAGFPASSGSWSIRLAIRVRRYLRC